MDSTPKQRRTQIDWSRVKRRLAAAEEALARDFAPPEKERRAILHARAQAAMQTPEANQGSGDGAIEVVKFELAQEQYALESSWVQAVLPLKELTPLPCTPAFVLGIIHVHGRILSVIDLKRLFELPNAGLSNLNKLLILSHGDTEYGILADSILGVSHLQLSMLQAPLATWKDQRSEYVRGVTSDGVVVLDALRLTTSKALVVDQEVIA